MPLQMRNRDIGDWDAEDVDAWNDGGTKIAPCNLTSSVVAGQPIYSTGATA